MDQFYSRLESAKTFIKLTADLVASNFVSIILLYLASTIVKFLFHFTISDVTGFASIMYFAYVVIDFFFINVTIAYMVRCYSEDVAFDFREAFVIILKNIIAFIIFITLITLLFTLLSFAINLGSKNPSSLADVVGMMDNIIYFLAIFIFVGLPVCTWISIRFGYFTYLMGLYDVSLPDALSGSFQITKHMFFKIFFLNICLFWEIGVFNYFIKKGTGFVYSIVIIIISSIFALFYAICNSFIALNLVYLHEDEDEDEEEYLESDNKKIQTYIDINNYFDYNTDNNMGESKVGLLDSSYDIVANDLDNDPWRYSN